MIDISIIILSYNGKELLARTLDSINRNSPLDISVETIVVDNASQDGSVEMLQRDYSWIHLILNNENVGFSKGNNIGVAASKGKYILFLNSDTEVFPGTIDYVFNQMKNDVSVGIGTCRVELANGEIDPASHRGFPTPWRAFTYFSGLEKLVIRVFNTHRNLKKLFGGYHLVERDLKISHEIDSCIGAFMLVPRTVGDKIGWWSDDYFMYGEDLDFCFKVHQLGLKVMYYPQFKILHLKHASGLKKQSADQSAESVEKARAIRRKTTAAFYDSMVIFYEKFYKTAYPGIVRYVVYAGIYLKKWMALRKI